MDVRITRPVLVCRRSRGFDSRRVDNGPGTNLDSLRPQVAINLLEDPPADFVRFQARPESANSRSFRVRVCRGGDADARAHRPGLVESCFDCVVRPVEPVLQEVEVQNAPDPDRPTPTIRLRTARIDEHGQGLPRHKLIHLVQEDGVPCQLPEAIEPVQPQSRLSRSLGTV